MQAEASQDDPMAGLCRCQELYWFGCYGSEARFKKYVTPESFRHPAKAAFRLTERIFQHLEHLGLLKQGDTVIDFMAGSARIPLVAAMRGYRTVAVELEPHFVKMIDRYVCDGKMRESKTMARCGETDPEKKHDPHYCMVRDFRNRFGKWQDTSVELRVLCDGVFREYYRQDCYYFHEEFDHSAHEVVGNMNILERNLQRPVEYTVIQGDSRNLSQLLEKSGVGVISPPYMKEKGSHDDAEYIKKRIEQGKIPKDHPRFSEKKLLKGEQIGSFSRPSYNPDNPKNIGNLPDLAAVTSVPYSQHDDRVSKGKIQGGFIEDCLTRTYEKGNHSKTEGNIADLPDKAGVISPPHENTETPVYSAGSMVGKGLEDHMATRGSRNRRYGAAAKVGVTSPAYDNRLADNDLRQFMDGEGRFKRPQTSYGGDKSNIGNKQGETYLEAMSRVYSEAFKAGISPLCVITKNPTRNHVLRRLDLDTALILQKCGYVLHDYHRAVLYDFEVNETLDGSQATDYHGRLSFFKRLSLTNGNTAAQWEDVLIAVIPNKHGVAGAISPPYRDSAVSPQGGGVDQRFNDAYREYVKTGDHKKFQEAMSREASSAGYSRNPRNIGNLSDKVGVVSPPYAESIKGGKSGIEWQEEWGKPSESRQPSQTIEYSKGKGNIGNLMDRTLNDED